jgi:hypothetical protein
VERDPIAFRINDDCAKTVFADLLSLAQNFSAVLTGRFDCFLQTSLD